MPSDDQTPTADPGGEPGYWNPVSGVQLAVASGALLGLTLALLFSRGFIVILDHANLAFHEAGHLFFAVLGSTAALYGGTLGQLVFPTVAVLVFSWRREAVSACLAGAWFFENLFNIARYMADARARVLPLVGGGEHDWALIFSRWGALHLDTRVASVTRGLGWAGIVLLWAWLCVRWWHGRGTPDQVPRQNTPR